MESAMPQWWNFPGIRSALSVALRQPHLAIPHLRVKNVSAIDFAALKAKGATGVCFDKDNCLSEPYASQIHSSAKAGWMACIEVFGPESVLVVSNSAGSADDLQGKEADALSTLWGIPVLRHAHKKPECGKEILDHFAKKHGSTLVMVGDRVLTDVVQGHRIGMFTVLTQPITERGDSLVALYARRLELLWLSRQQHKCQSHPLL